MLLHRPSFTKEQIRTLKADIKLLARHVSSEADIHPKIGPNFAYNAFAKLMGYSAFSQLTLNENTRNYGTPDFDFFRDIEIKDVYEAFKSKNINLGQAERGFQSAIDSLRPVADEITKISLERVSEILLNSCLSDSQNVTSDYEPNEFKATLNDAFFKDLSLEQHFVISCPDGKMYYYTVVDLSPHIYDERIQVLTIRKGLWVSVENGGFCAGLEYKG